MYTFVIPSSWRSVLLEVALSRRLSRSRRIIISFLEIITILAIYHAVDIRLSDRHFE